jgi:2-hydroxychromene-2-carboxylate isomerase
MAALVSAGAEPSGAFARAEASDVKDQLRENTDEAQKRGLFGAPSFTTESGELFWGDDRLDQALAWCRRG